MLRPRVLTAAAFAVVAAVAFGSAGQSGPLQAAPTPTYYEDIKPILDGRCVSCHTLGGIAPFPLTSYTAAAKRRAAVSRAVTQRLMPPWHAAPGHRRYLHDPSLTTAQIAAIRRWAAAGAPRGNPTRPGTPMEPVGGGLSRTDAELALPSYTPQRGAHDDYRCFALPWNRPTAYVTGLDAVPGERREVHHMLVYLAGAADAATVDAWDASDSGPGYGCFGGPSAGGGTSIAVQPIGGWVPGFEGGDFPRGTGIRVAEGSRLIVQVHYNLEATRAKPDRSRVRVKLADAVEKRAFSVPVVDFRWLLAPQTFRIPSGKKRVVHAYSTDLGFALRVVGAGALAGGFTIHGVALHMHRLGKRGRLVLERGSGSREVLLAIERWDFDWQRGYELADPVRVTPGDRVSIRCEHDNSRANQPVVHGRRARPRTLTWGENSSDEMCVGFLFVSEP